MRNAAPSYFTRGGNAQVVAHPAPSGDPGHLPWPGRPVITCRSAADRPLSRLRKKADPPTSSPNERSLGLGYSGGTHRSWTRRGQRLRRAVAPPGQHGAPECGGAAALGAPRPARTGCLDAPQCQRPPASRPPLRGRVSQHVGRPGRVDRPEQFDLATTKASHRGAARVRGRRASQSPRDPD